MAKRRIIRLNREQLEAVVLDHFDVVDDFGPDTPVKLNTQIFTNGCCNDEKVLFSFDITEVDITEVVDETLGVDESG